MTIKKDDVIHVAKLAKIKLNAKEVESFTKDLANVLDHFSVLQEVETDEVIETSQVTGLENVTRADEILVRTQSENKDLLQCSNFPVEKNSIKIPKVI